MYKTAKREAFKKKLSLLREAFKKIYHFWGVVHFITFFLCLEMIFMQGKVDVLLDCILDFILDYLLDFMLHYILDYLLAYILKYMIDYILDPILDFIQDFIGWI